MQNAEIRMQNAEWEGDVRLFSDMFGYVRIFKKMLGFPNLLVEFAFVLLQRDPPPPRLRHGKQDGKSLMANEIKPDQSGSKLSGCTKVTIITLIYT